MIVTDGDAFAPVVIKNAAALVVGGELLSGKIRDENLYHLSRALTALGICLRRVIFCPDERDIISHDLRELARNHDVVFTSGGIGPTHDDVTMAGVADALGAELTESSRFVEILEQHYQSPLTAGQRRMASVPLGCRLLESTDVRWPTIVAGNIWILPGIPELFRMKLRAVRDHLKGPTPLFSRDLFLNVEEAHFVDTLDEIVAANPEVQIGSYPKWFDPHYKTRLTFDSRVEGDVDRALTMAEQLLRAFVVQ